MSGGQLLYSRIGIHGCAIDPWRTAVSHWSCVTRVADLQQVWHCCDIMRFTKDAQAIWRRQWSCAPDLKQVVSNVKALQIQRPWGPSSLIRIQWCCESLSLLSVLSSHCIFCDVWIFYLTCAKVYLALQDNLVTSLATTRDFESVQDPGDISGFCLARLQAKVEYPCDMNINQQASLFSFAPFWSSRLWSHLEQ